MEFRRLLLLASHAMIQEIVDFTVMQAQAPDLLTAMDGRLAQATALSPALEAQARVRDLTVEDLRQAREVLHQLVASEDRLKDDEKNALWMPSDADAGILQSCLEEAYLAAGAVAESGAKGLGGEVPPLTGQALKPEWRPTNRRGFMRQMEESDVLGWTFSFAFAEAIKLARGRAAFPPQPAESVSISSRARLVLVGDWASGIPRAGLVAKAMRQQVELGLQDGRQCHVIHLGDVYYAGRDFEYATNFAPTWPVFESEATTVGSWCVNANHDMFTGGHGFFKYLRTDGRFHGQRGASYFCLENADWQIFGLDTAYESEGFKGDAGGLQDPQCDWILRRRQAAPYKRTIFLSHHQLFSAYENESPLLKRKLAPVFALGKPINAWFWGHEHRGSVYHPTDTVRYPVVLGHGGVPVYATKRERPKTVRFELREDFRHGLESFSRFGFAVVDLDGAQAEVRYVNELGAGSKLDHGRSTHTIPVD